MNKTYQSILLAAVFALLLPSTALAQQQRGERGGRNFDPAQFQQRMLDRYQGQLGINDEDWKVISPLVEDVFAKQMAARTRGFRGGFGGGRAGRGGGGERGSRGGRGGGERGGRGGGEPDPAQEALAKVLESDSTSSEEIQAKLKAYRASREKKASALAKAREDLRAVLTTRQEGKAVLAGLLP